MVLKGLLWPDQPAASRPAGLIDASRAGRPRVPVRAFRSTSNDIDCMPNPRRPYVDAEPSLVPLIAIVMKMHAVNGHTEPPR